MVLTRDQHVPHPHGVQESLIGWGSLGGKIHVHIPDSKWLAPTPTKVHWKLLRAAFFYIFGRALSGTQHRWKSMFTSCCTQESQRLLSLQSTGTLGPTSCSLNIVFFSSPGDCMFFLLKKIDLPHALGALWLFLPQRSVVCVFFTPKKLFLCSLWCDLSPDPPV